MKAETRRPKEGRNPKSEKTDVKVRTVSGFGLRVSGLLSALRFTGHIHANRSLEPSTGCFVIVQGLNLRGPCLCKRRLRAQDVQLGTGAGFASRSGQSQSFFSLFNHFFL